MTTTAPKTAEFKTGDLVISHDNVDGPLDGRPASYVLGQIRGTHVADDGTTRWHLSIVGDRDGERWVDDPSFSRNGHAVFPPVNGTPRLFGDVTRGVEFYLRLPPAVRRFTGATGPEFQKACRDLGPDLVAERINELVDLGLLEPASVASHGWRVSTWRIPLDPAREPRLT